MNTSIFKKSDFELCVLANPTGYPSSYTHVGVVYSPNGYNGYHWFFSQSPFPSFNDTYENPCFYYANSRENGKQPIDLIAYSGNPLQEQPYVETGGYNADPDILFFNGDLYVTNRPYNGIHDGVNTYQCVNAQKCIIVNGQFTFSNPVVLYDTRTLPTNFGYPLSYTPTLLSPAFIVWNNELRSYHLVSNSSNDAGICRNMVIMHGTDLVTEQNFQFLKYGSILSKNGINPWHLDVFEYNNKLYAVIACNVGDIDNNTYNFLAVSEDGENFKLYNRPLSDIKSYRSTACILPDGTFVLYLATLDYKPVGNVSQDGRNIVTASMNFEELIKRIDE